MNGDLRPSGPGGEPRAVTLRSAEFRKGREHVWRQLDGIVSLAEAKGIASLSAEEARQLPLLYRAAMSSLSVARAIVLDRGLLLYLENLTLRAYLVVYGPRAGVLQSLFGFFRRGFPRSVRRMGLQLGIVFAVMLAGTVAGYALVRSDMGYYNVLIPPSLAGGRGPGSSAKELEAVLFAPWPGFAESFIVFGNFLFRHNTMVGIFSFGLGFMLGVPTLALMAYNGLILGAFIALHAAKGLAAACAGWLLIHGVTEILAILLCGAAGLTVAGRILFPGPLPRLESLALHGREAAGAAAGAILLFFVAGCLEGGFRQLVSSTPGRCLIALATALLWGWYFLAAGRDDNDDAP